MKRWWVYFQFYHRAKALICFLAMGSKISSDFCDHCTSDSKISGSPLGQTHWGAWGSSEAGCLAGSQVGSRTSNIQMFFIHCSEQSPGCLHLCFQAEAAAWALCCGSDGTQWGHPGTWSIAAGHRPPQAVVAAKIVLSQIFAAEWSQVS